MRIAHFVQRYPPAVGGAEAYFARLSRFLAAKGDEVVVFTTNALDLESFWNPLGRRLPAGRSMEQGVGVARFAQRTLPLGHPYVFKLLSMLPYPLWQRMTFPFNPISPGMLHAALWGKERFDVVHAACFPYSWPMECGRRMARRLRVPFLLTPFVHTGDPDNPRDRTRRGYTREAFVGLARDADRVFVQTEGERQVLQACGVAADRFVMQGMGLDVAGCTGGDSAQAQKEWGVVPGETVVGHLSNNSREKGTVDLLKAAQRAWDQGARLRVVLAGPAMPNFRSFWDRFTPRGPVVRLGVLTERQKKDFFAGIDVFALPSRCDSFGLVLPEAWANEKPCVVYRAGGLPWVVQDGCDGLVVPCGDLGALAAALVRLAWDEELRRRLGAAGWGRVEGGEFNWEAKLGVVREAYQEASRERQRPEFATISPMHSCH
jgi:glycosyltransferase involved in cell wall biosynthesis